MKEVPNNLRSRQFAKIIDLLSEGPIRGVVNGLQGVYFDGTQLQKPSGELTYKNTSVQFVNGVANQPIMTGFSSSEAEESVGLRLFYGQPLIRTIVNTDADRCRVTVSVPSLSYTSDKGDVDGAFVWYTIAVKPSGGSWQSLGALSIIGKTTSRYQRATVFALPGKGPWDIKVERTVIDSPTMQMQNDIYWDSYTMIVDDHINYAHSACVGITIDAEQFGAVPKRIYLVDGLLIRIPSNYNPYTAAYTGVWDGKFKTDWCNNPAWIFYDLITNNRYGLGSFISSALVDIWSLYKIGQFCDQRIPNGKGGYERRYTCNVQIMDQSEAFDLLSDIASIFRGFAFWAGGKLVASADMPMDPVMQFNNSNVIDGSFNYSGADIRARHTLVNVTWQDPQNLGEGRVASVDDWEQVSRFGINAVDVTIPGCTSETQAHRSAKWTLYTEQFESESVTFSSGLETAWGRPGDVIRISDRNIVGRRMGGRVVGIYQGNTHLIQVDVRPPMADGVTYQLSCVIPTADKNVTTVQTRAAVVSSIANVIYVNPPFSAAPLPDSVFVLNDPGDIEPTLWKVLGIKQQERDKYEIQGLRHYPQKWDYVEKNIHFALPKNSIISRKPPPAKNLAVKEYLVQTSAISVGVRATISWQSSAPQFDLWWRKPPGNWSRVRTDGQAYDIAIVEGKHEFKVVPFSAIGIAGDAATITKDIIGRFAPPLPPKNFRVQIVEGVALFSWDPATELDVIIGGYFQLRHTTATTYANWSGSQIKVPTVPGKSSSVSTSYQPGSWLLRTFDITERPSATWAMITSFVDDDRYFQWSRICESPSYLGTHTNTQIVLPQEWLTIKDVDKGYIDDQNTNIDSWGPIDTLPVPSGVTAGPNVGSYKFAQRFDAGGEFPVRFSTEILAFGFASQSDFIDGRLGDVDTWENWDDTSAEYGGQVTLQIRTTKDDPALTTAKWSDWENFITGDYTGRGFEFQVILKAPAGENIGVEQLCITGDFRMKYTEGGDVAYAAAPKTINYGMKFYNLPSIVVTVQNAAADDIVKITTKTRDYFTISITNPALVHQIRTFDWHAQGY